MTLWKGRLGEHSAKELMDFTQSIDFDKRLALDDLFASKAHVKGLGKASILTEKEVETLLEGLDVITLEVKEEKFVFTSDDEDIHSAIERRLTELSGDTGAKVHTGRSRNDQVATALRLYVKRELKEVAKRVLSMQQVLLQLAEKHQGTYLPGYTHLQRAQPILLSHHFLAHGWALARDIDRIIGSIRRTDVSPLGAGALAGSSLNLDPKWVAHELGFLTCFDNSLDAVSDRDFVAEALFDLTLISIHLSRMGEEIVLWSTEEFGFMQLDDSFATGSSMLPQKKNPDIAELARGKSGRLIGNLVGLLTTLKGLPLAYNRDLQEDKEPIFDSIDTIKLALNALTGLLQTAVFNESKMIKAADAETSVAVDLAEWLVQRGVPFRKAHQIIGGLVKEASERGVPLSELVQVHPDLGEESVFLLEPGTSIKRRISHGSAGPEPFKIQIKDFITRLEQDARRLGVAEGE